MKLSVAAALLTCGHIKIWRPSKLIGSQESTWCPSCRKSRNIKSRNVADIEFTFDDLS